ncbi:tRNA uridine-5-carboxymethylaminomethyl(34) synthesis GTPase MnmE [Roseiterribacter gracilis]|uniref:tRNA modification GTPase MnmE n=1 Tax=Roseiterribacter gracilis TaxID=2812848 RepID=A0A8S8XFK4_9PROT|nr:tRNA modification GTPase MnmE [Rhodospirillales bacterium TMPK1]
MTETIFALASAPGPAGVAVVRIAGDRAHDIARALVGDLPKPRVAARRLLRDPNSGESIDDALLLVFSAPASFTGDDVVELHTHGGRAVYAAIVRALLALNARPAEPGEFSKRAFLAGKLTLDQTEAIADLVAAETEAQRRQALRQLGGALAARADGWRASLVEAMAAAEAEIDFPDEDLPAGLEQRARTAIVTLRDELAIALEEGKRGEALRDGIEIAVLGPPNAGKSSLINYLSGRDVAIVSPIAGTTRDAIEVRLDLGGWPVTLIDTAGLRDSTDPIEQEGVRRARARAEQADLSLWLTEAAEAGVPSPIPGAICVATKTDLALAPAGWLGISTITGVGLGALLATLEGAVADILATSGAAIPTRERHLAAITEARDALHRALQADLPELMAEDLRLAARALGRIAGRVDVEDVLDRLFASFCIGK